MIQEHCEDIENQFMLLFPGRSLLSQPHPSWIIALLRVLPQRHSCSLRIWQFFTMASSDPPQTPDYKSEFLQSCLSANVLTFGNFTLKSGRVSPVRASQITALPHVAEMTTSTSSMPVRVFILTSIPPIMSTCVWKPPLTIELPLVGLFHTGSLLRSISTAYAYSIIDFLSSTRSPSPEFDILFGPAYKGISPYSFPLLPIAYL